MRIFKQTSHGLYKHKYYDKWNAMRKRCYSVNDKRYKNYGGRGISVCKEWLYNPLLYFHYIGELKNAGKKGYSVDRINNDGNYEPGNLRWATYDQQAVNRSKKSNNTSGYTGVSFHIRLNKWGSNIGVNNKQKSIGYYNSKHWACFYRNKYIVENNLSHKIQHIILNKIKDA